MGSRVLVADDNPGIREAIVEILEGRGFEAAEVSNGQECLNAMKREIFDLLVLDIMMPGIDGFSVLRALRNTELHTGRHIPVLCITGMPDASFEQKCYEWGSDGFIQKPFKMATFVEKVNELLDAVPRAEAPPVDAGEIFDYGRLLGAFGGKRQIVQEILDLFVSESQERLGRLTSARREGDLPEVGVQAHTLKSISGTVGAGRLQKHCARLESCATNRQTAEIDDLVSIVESELKIVLEHIAALN